MPVVLLLLYVVTSMIGLLNIPWTMTAELFPIEIRGMGHSISLSIANLLMFVAVQLYYPLSSILGGIVMVQWFFGVMSITASLYVFVILPETHNKKLSEITEYFNEKTIYLSLGKKKSTTPQRRRRVEKRDIVRLDDQSQKLMNSV